MKKPLSFAESKKIYDAVHGFIRFNALERELVDSLAFQRLQHIHQLGIAFLVYPGATHTRFEHSLGTMEVATRIFDHLLKKQMQLDDPLYWRQIVRFAALCHDLGHLPFSHDAESALLGKAGHEEWTMRLILSETLKPLWDKISAYFPGRTVSEDVISIAVGEQKLRQMGWKRPSTPNEKILSEIITADFFGADRIDYLIRDAKCTGVSYGIFDYHQLIEMLCILPTTDSFALGIEGGGIESCEALLLARHFMHQRVYQYVAVQAYKFHLRRFMKSYFSRGKYLDSLPGYLSQSDVEVMAALRAAASDPKAVGHEDAQAILLRKNRFHALAIDPQVSEEQIEKTRQLLNISAENVYWSLCKKQENWSLSFPVLMPSGALRDAEQCAQVRAFGGKKSWVFISPHVDEALRLQLEKALHGE